MSDVRACQAYIHVLEAEVADVRDALADVRARLAEYEQMYDIQFKDAYGPGGELVGHLIATGRNQLFQITSVNVYVRPVHDALVHNVEIRNANNTLASWIGASSTENCLLVVIMHGHNGWVEIMCSIHLPGRFICTTEHGHTQFMSTQNTERVVRKIAENFPITLTA
jgi:hypothetical protein